MATNIVSLDFINADRNSPLVTITGDRSRWLATHSEHLRILQELDPGRRGITIPVSLPTDRALILRRILRQQPVGMLSALTGEPIYYPLGPQEEAAIAAAMPTATPDELNRERGRVVQEVLQYLMLDPDAEAEMLLFIDEPSNVNHELQRRRNITYRRSNKRNLPYLNEDEIERMIEAHKDYLFDWYYLNEPKMRMKLSKNNIETRKKKVQKQSHKDRENLARLDRLRNNLEQRAARFRFGRAENLNAIYNEIDHLEEARRDLMNRSSPFPNTYPINQLYNGLNTSVRNMTPIELERYLRSKRREGEEKYLPFQRNTLNLENIYGPPNI